ncbi:MAG: hypothetical protein IPM29_10165 [Planctomycetes bacterium]|nr:hypothetical protein [Planctomycetota bacterium]
MSASPEAALSALRAALAAVPSGFDAPTADRAAVDAAAGPGAATYGELAEAAFLKLLRWLAPGPDDALYDLGSGTGLLVWLAALTTRVGRAVGIELSAFRHAAALAIRARLRRELGLGAIAAVELRNEDLRTTALGDATIVFAASTCFPDPLLAALARRLGGGAAPRLRTLISTRPLPQPWDRALPARGTLHVPATWAPRVRLYVHAGPRPR